MSSGDAEQVRRCSAAIFCEILTSCDALQFKALSVVHAILSDEAKRKAYDTTGEIDTHEMSADAEVWYDYFRNLFPKVTVDKIEVLNLSSSVAKAKL